MSSRAHTHAYTRCNGGRDSLPPASKRFLTTSRITVSIDPAPFSRPPISSQEGIQAGAAPYLVPCKAAVSGMTSAAISNNYARSEGQNLGNFLTDRRAEHCPRVRRRVRAWPSLAATRFE